MKILKVLITLLTVLIYVSDAQQDPAIIEVKLLEKVLTDMFGSSRVYVCIYDSDKKEAIERYSTKIVITNCNQANIIITDRYLPENSKPVFALNDEIIKSLKNAIGGLYWKKGRPQLIFLEDRLDKFNIRLPSEYKGFIVNSKNLGYTSVYNTKNIKIACNVKQWF